MQAKGQNLKKRRKMQLKNLKLFAITLYCIGFTGLRAQTLKDIEGNVYSTITIGTQIWMTENLKTTKYNNGTAIESVTDNKAWEALATSAFCWYKNDSTANKNTYGALYNWYSVNTKKICPIGWHVPTDAEWTILTTFLGGERVAGNKLKETGKKHWSHPNAVATNESGFTALPSGYRFNTGSFFYIGEYCSWWSSSESDSNNAWFRYLNDSDGIVRRSGFNKRCGFSVRCLRDN